MATIFSFFFFFSQIDNQRERTKQRVLWSMHKVESDRKSSLAFILTDMRLIFIQATELSAKLFNGSNKK